MAPVKARLEFLARLPLYDTEKPYLLLPSKEQNLDPDKMRLDNLEFESYEDVLIDDMRGHEDLDLNECGFEFYPHETKYRSFKSPQDIDGYVAETEQALKKRFSAARVLTYEVRLRKNEDFQRKEFDIYDKMLVEGPARGAHVGETPLKFYNTPTYEPDVTFTSGPRIIQKYLPADEHDIFLRPGYRFRIFNTWRPLNNVLEDRPLALCDSRTVAVSDLIAADRILPDRVGEVYYLQHAPDQKWYWLERQRVSEPFIFLMYDTASSHEGARFCPHVSFDNPRKSAAAELRSSIETRSIVITAEQLPTSA